jgi:hypothetical protein
MPRWNSVTYLMISDGQEARFFSSLTKPHSCNCETRDLTWLRASLPNKDKVLRSSVFTPTRLCSLMWKSLHEIVQVEVLVQQV